MIRPYIWTLLLGTLVVMTTSVRAQCNPSHAVVAVASVLSTLAFVTVVLIGAYFFMRRRRPVQKVLQGPNKANHRRDGHSNRAFSDNEDFVTLEEGVTPSKLGGQANSTRQVLSRRNKDDKARPPPVQRSGKHGKRYRGDSRGSLDETVTFVAPEIISVTLESQDIIGLGFNIYGGYGDGIRVSEVHNRGPAKESGVIKVGDRILSVTVSYQNIVYEDALTILSYASPYPVTIVLEKITDDNLKNFVDEKQKGSLTQRINHPLYHRRSLDALKPITQTQLSTYPKRAFSDLKLESVKHLLNWHGKNSKKTQVSSEKDGVTLSKQFQPRNGASALEENVITSERIVPSEAEFEKVQNAYVSKDSFAINKYPIKQPGHLKAGHTTHETVAEIMPTFYANFGEEDCYQKSPPDKPERKNRRKSDTQNSSMMLTLENDLVTSSRKAFVYPISSVTDDEIDVDDIIQAPELSGPFNVEYESMQDEDITNRVGTLEHVNADSFVGYTQQGLSPLPGANPVEDAPVNAVDRSNNSFPPPSSDFPIIVNEDSNNNSKSDRQFQNIPVLDEETLNRIIAMNTFAPGTQGWAGVLAGGSHGGIIDDFLPNHPLFTTPFIQNPNGEVLSPGAKPHKPSESESNITSAVPVHNKGNIAYEIRDDIVTANPISMEINKNKYIAQQPQVQHADGSNDANLVILPTSIDFINNQTNSHSSTGSLGDINEGSEISDTLEWSGTRLVRSESFSNIFVNDL